MGSTEVAVKILPQDQEACQPRRRFKTSELPLSATQRSDIDGLLHTLKKKGHYDTVRKNVWSQFVESDANNNFKDRLHELADAEIDRDPSLLSRDRGKAATLMQGAVDRSDVYKTVEVSLDRLISAHLSHVLEAGREVRKAEIGEEAAAEEERRGAITDEEYAKDAAIRREARERQRKQDENRKRREEEKEQLRAEAMKKEAELDQLRRADERRRERIAREEQLQAERKKREDEDAERRRCDDGNREEKAGRDERSRPPKEEPRSRQRSIEQVQTAGKGSSRSPHPLKEEDTTAASTTVPKIDMQAIEAAALDLLVRDAREAAKSGSKPQIDRSESLEPPHRIPHMLKPKSTNISPSKSAGLCQPLKTEVVKTKLSFSATNVSRDAVTQREPPPLQRNRSRSPLSVNRNASEYRKRSPSRAHRDQDHNRAHEVEDEYRRRPSRTPRQDSEANSYEWEASRHSYRQNREDTQEKEPERHHHREKTYDRDDRSRYHHGNREEKIHQATNGSRSVSHGHHDQDRDRNQGRYKEDYQRSHHRESREHRHGRSRSPHKSSDPKHGHEDSEYPESEHRTKSPVEIDRYRPCGSAHTKEDNKDKPRHRDRGSEVRDERHRDRGSDIRDERHRYRDTDPRDERHRDRDRDRGRDDGRHRERRDDRDEYRSRHSERDRDRDRDRGDRNRGYEKERRDDNTRDRIRDKDRRDDGHERGDRGKGYVEIDRYVPSGGSGARDDAQRARGRE
ncbi:MAG: hypothetical protein Q9184_000919 [Pyrenodesmia sp. 2 TL-2023]